MHLKKISSTRILLQIFFFHLGVKIKKLNSSKVIFLKYFYAKKYRANKGLIISQILKLHHFLNYSSFLLKKLLYNTFSLKYTPHVIRQSKSSVIFYIILSFRSIPSVFSKGFKRRIEMREDRKVK